MFRRTRIWLLLLVVVGLGAPLVAAAQEPKPVLVMALAPVDDLLADVDHLAKTLGNAEAGKSARQLIGPYLASIDRKRPAGAYVTIAGEELTAVAFVPISSMKGLLALIETQLGAPKEVGDGVFKFDPPPGLQKNEDEPQAIFLKEQNGWAFVAGKAEELKTLPQDPAKLLGDLTKRYDLAYRVSFENIPVDQRRTYIEQLRKETEKALAENVGAAAPEVSPEVMRSLLDWFATYIEGTQSMEFGLSIDSAAKHTSLAFAMDASAGSDLAKSFASARDLTPAFPGLLSRGAAMLQHRQAKFSPKEVADWDKLIDEFLKDLKEVPQPANGKMVLTDEERRMLPDLLKRFIKATYADGKTEWGSAMLVVDGKICSISGGHLVGAKKLVGEFRAFADRHKAEMADLGTINWDFAKHKDVQIVKLELKEKPAGVDIYGGDLSQYVGIAENAIYAAQGVDAVRQLREAIDRSETPSSLKSMPYRVRVDVASLAKLAAAQTKDRTPAVDSLLATLTDATRSYAIQVQLAAPPATTGKLEGRLTVDDGVLVIAPQLFAVVSEWVARIAEESQKNALEGL